MLLIFFGKDFFSPNTHTFLFFMICFFSFIAYVTFSYLAFLQCIVIIKLELLLNIFWIILYFLIWITKIFFLIPLFLLYKKQRLFTLMKLIITSDRKHQQPWCLNERKYIFLMKISTFYLRSKKIPSKKWLLVLHLVVLSCYWEKNLPNR